MESCPLVSVNMPVYNGERFVGEAITSILAQRFSDFELVIVDDGSTDKTAEIIRGFHDLRVKLVQNNKNLGLAKARNAAVKASKGKYIAILDGDDIAYPERLRKQVDFLEENPSYCLVCSCIDEIDSSGNVIGKKPYQIKDREIQSALFFTNFIAQSSVMLRKEMLPSADPYDIAFPPAEDYHLWVRMAAKHPMHIISEPLVKYRLHEGNVSSRQRERMNLAVKNILRYQLLQLGFPNVSEEEMELQLALAYGSWPNGRAFVEKANRYFTAVERANKKSKYFSPNAFKKSRDRLMRAPLNAFFVRETYDTGLFGDLFGKSVQAAKYLPPVVVLRLLLKSLLYYRPKNGLVNTYRFK